MAAREHHDKTLPEPPTLPIRPLERADTYPLAGPKADLRASEGKVESGQTLNNGQQAKSISGQDCGNPKDGEVSGTVPQDDHFYREHGRQEPPYPVDPRDTRQQRPASSRDKERSRDRARLKRHSERSTHDRAKTEVVPRARSDGVSKDGHPFTEPRPRPSNARRQEDMLDEDEARIDELKRQNKKIDKAYQRLKKDFDELAADTEGLRRDLIDRERQIAVLQTEHLEMSRRMGSSQAEDDDIVRDKIKNCTSAWRQWAKVYAINDLSKVKREQRNDVEVLFAASSAPGDQAAVSWIWSSEFGQSLPRMILNATLAKMIADTIIKEPFFNLIAPGTHGSDSVARDLDFVYREAQKDDPIVAHAWRSHTVKIFDKYMSKKDPVAPSQTAPRRDNYYRQLVLSFEHSSVKALFRDDSSVNPYQRQDELCDMLRDAGELFLSLWTQRVWITTWSIEELKGADFRICSKYMEPHVCHGLVDGDDTSLDGRPVSAVIQPAILAYGNEHGRNYDQNKVWAKAVVFLGPAPPAKAPVKKR